jgi:hypothetical protein
LAASGSKQPATLQADMSRSTFLAAAFVLAARKRKVRVDSRKVIEQLAAPRPDFNRVCEDMKARTCTPACRTVKRTLCKLARSRLS